MSHDSKLRHTVFILKIWFAAELLPAWLYGLLPWFLPLRFLPAALGISTFFEIEGVEDQGTKLQSSVCRIHESKRPFKEDSSETEEWSSNYSARNGLSIEQTAYEYTV